MRRTDHAAMTMIGENIGRGAIRIVTMMMKGNGIEIATENATGTATRIERENVKEIGNGIATGIENESATGTGTGTAKTDTGIDITIIIHGMTKKPTSGQGRSSIPPLSTDHITNIGRTGKLCQATCGH